MIIEHLLCINVETNIYLEKSILILWKTGILAILFKEINMILDKTDIIFNRIELNSYQNHSQLQNHLDNQKPEVKLIFTKYLKELYLYFIT